MGDRNASGVGAPCSVDRLDEVFLTERQLAERHQRSVRTLRNARVYGGYVKFVKIGRSVRYRLSDVLEYERANVLRSTSDGDGPGRQ
jgi:hypothetical protein